MKKPLSEIASMLSGRLVGSGDVCIEGIASLEQAGPADLSFLTDIAYAEQLTRTQAGALLLAVDYDGSTPSVPQIRVANVNDALETLLVKMGGEPDYPLLGIDASASIDPTAKIGPDVAIGPHVSVAAGARIGARTVLYPGCRIGRNVVIGEQCILYANVVINWGCQLGNQVIIHPNSTIGADGFGYRMVDGQHKKIPHIGIVVIEDDVEIGANSCVDRAKFDQTVIGRNTKIDNLVQVAHNVRIGSSSILVAQVGLAGSCELGRYVVLGGQTGVSDHVKIQDGTMVAGHSAIIGNTKPGTKLMGMPARGIKDFFREQALLKRLPGLFKEFKQVKQKLDRIAESKDHS